MTARKKSSLKAGDSVRIRSSEEIRNILDKNQATEGLVFMPSMFQYCGTTQKVLKTVKFAYDEHAWRMKKIKNVVILDGVICHGKDRAAQGGCDRSCFFFWKEAWLEKA
jgi:hypothetical protein